MSRGIVVGPFERQSTSRGICFPCRFRHRDCHRSSNQNNGRHVESVRQGQDQYLLGHEFTQQNLCLVVGSCGVGKAVRLEVLLHTVEEGLVGGRAPRRSARQAGRPVEADDEALTASRRRRSALQSDGPPSAWPTLRSRRCWRRKSYDHLRLSDPFSRQTLAGFTGRIFLNRTAPFPVALRTPSPAASAAPRHSRRAG